MRMTASWSGRYGPTEYKVVARYFAPDGKLPLGLLCCPTKKITGARSKSALTENAPYKACSAFTRVAACTLALPPIRDTLIEGFSHFVTSMTAPIASGWSGCRVGLAPTGKRRLCTAHANNGSRPSPGVANDAFAGIRACDVGKFTPVRTENLIRVDAVMESPKLAE